MRRLVNSKLCGAFVLVVNVINACTYLFVGDLAKGLISAVLSLAVAVIYDQLHGGRSGTGEASGGSETAAQ